jgi:hypothetical protein
MMGKYIYIYIYIYRYITEKRCARVKQLYFIRIMEHIGTNKVKIRRRNI